MDTALLAALQRLLPEAFVDGAVDLARLRRALGGEAAPACALGWPGKEASARLAEAPPVGRLVQDGVVGSEPAENTFVVGDNLEVLKLLRETHLGRVKLIYIDPPYNTGADFSYRDDFRDGADRHGPWLGMMLPRLILGRDLLADDGFLAVSIDENEAAHLRLVLDEVFGPDGFVGAIAWRKGSGGNDVAFSYTHEQVLLYRKTAGAPIGKVPQSGRQQRSYRNPDGDPRGPWTSSDYTSKWSRHERPNLWYPIAQAHTGAECWPPDGRTWAYSREETDRNVAEGRLWWGVRGRNARPRFKRFHAQTGGRMSPRSFWDDVGTSEDGTRAFRALGFTKDDFPHPKPLGLIRRLLRIGAPDGGLVLDFFAGSGSTAHAIAEAHRDDPATRWSWILVQLPEPVVGSAFPDLAEVCRARLERVAQSVAPKGTGAFRVLRHEPG